MNGCTEVPRLAATETAMGATMSTVAVLLTICPSRMVSRQMVSNATWGPNPPTNPSSQSATMSAVPVVVNAVDSGIIPAIRTTVVHETERYA